MPAAHSTLWFMGVFILLWGLTLILRGFPPELGLRIMHRLRLGKGVGEASTRTQNRAHGDWRLIVGGGGAMVTGAFCLIMGLAVYQWVHGDVSGDLRLPIWGTTALAIAAFCISLLVWAIRGKRTRTRTCPKCRYDMTGNAATCPECGFAAQAEQDFFRTRRRWKVALAALVLLCLSPSLTMVPRYREAGVLGLVPSTVMIALFEHLPDSFIEAVTPADLGTLQGRFWDEDLFGWQRRWLEGRSRRLMASPKSGAMAVTRAAGFVDVMGSAETQRLAVRRFVEFLCDPSQKARDTVALSWSFNIPWLLFERPDAAEFITPHTDRLKSLLDDSTPEVGLAAAALLLGAEVHVDEALALSVTHTQPRMFTTMRAVQNFRLAFSRPEARAKALLLFQHADPAVRRMSIVAQRWNHELPPEAMEAVGNLLDDPDIGVAMAAASFLHLRQESGAVSRIVRAAARRPSDAERTTMLSQLRGQPEAMSQLSALLADPDAKVGLAAIEALRNLRDEQYDLGVVMEALRQAAASDDPAVAEAASALVREIEPETSDDPS